MHTFLYKYVCRIVVKIPLLGNSVSFHMSFHHLPLFRVDGNRNSTLTILYISTIHTFPTRESTTLTHTHH